MAGHAASRRRRRRAASAAALPRLLLLLQLQLVALLLSAFSVAVGPSLLSAVAVQAAAASGSSSGGGSSLETDNIGDACSELARLDAFQRLAELGWVRHVDSVAVRRAVFGSAFRLLMGDARRGQAHVVTLVAGDNGVGKNTLVDLARRALVPPDSCRRRDGGTTGTASSSSSSSSGRSGAGAGAGAGGGWTGWVAAQLPWGGSGAGAGGGYQERPEDRCTAVVRLTDSSVASSASGSGLSGVNRAVSTEDDVRGELRRLEAGDCEVGFVVLDELRSGLLEHDLALAELEEAGVVGSEEDSDEHGDDDDDDDDDNDDDDDDDDDDDGDLAEMEVNDALFGAGGGGGAAAGAATAAAGERQASLQRQLRRRRRHRRRVRRSLMDGLRALFEPESSRPPGRGMRVLGETFNLPDRLWVFGLMDFGSADHVATLDPAARLAHTERDFRRFFSKKTLQTTDVLVLDQLGHADWNLVAATTLRDVFRGLLQTYESRRTLLRRPPYVTADWGHGSVDPEAAQFLINTHVPNPSSGRHVYEAVSRAATEPLSRWIEQEQKRGFVASPDTAKRLWGGERSAVAIVRDLEHDGITVRYVDDKQLRQLKRVAPLCYTEGGLTAAERETCARRGAHHQE